jgi:muramoyltetrapeptide carboxypeptidase
VVFPAAAQRAGFLAGPDPDRLRDLQAAFDDEAIDAVWALRGGYGTQRIVDDLALDQLRRDPVPFLGFSDLTALHVRLGSVGVVSFHAPHPGEAFPAETEAHLRRVLFLAEAPGPLPTRPEDPPPRTLVDGVAEGPLIGGNLALLSSLCGTRDTPAARGAILALEEVGEPAYRVDRMLLQLLRSRVLDGVAGLALGRFTGRDQDDEERAVVTVLAEWAERLGVPAVRDLPFGHVAHNCTLPLGVRARLDGDRARLDLLEPAVRPR